MMLCLLAACVAPLAAHAVPQLYGELQGGEATWKVEILFDAGYAEPAARNDLAAPQPTRDWLVNLPEAEHRRLCKEAETYLRASLAFRSDRGPVAWRLSFPDFQKTPPDFPSLLNDGAYFHVLIEPLSPEKGSVTVAMAGGDHPNLVIKLPGDTAESRYLTVSPGSEAELVSGSAAEPVAESRHPAAIAFTQGVLHVRGLDHVLFVLGIFLLQRRWRPLLMQSLAFTAAHTIALGLASAGWVKVPTQFVEPIIALSIAALAVENLFMTEARPWRLVIVFAFGLVHGIGFAGAMSTWIRPGEGFLTALLAANLGVEAGQVIILLAAWLLTNGWHDSREWPHFRRWSCVALALTGLFWCVERTGWLPLVFGGV